ncbi:MAG: Glycosyltransferase involved in cell wall bisynthesis [Candidatus Nitrotoga sp. SPKER]|nr:MAG: Glycosyltransferase involved in cell wall bisynthesis [Candidatus Nitrotoga sp. SPKER]
MKCGVGTYTQKLAMTLAESRNVKVTVLTDERASEAMERNGVEVLSVIRGWRVTELIYIAKYVMQSNPDIVHIQYPAQGYSGRMPILIPLLMCLLCKHCVQTWHEPVFNGRASLLLTVGLKVLITVREEIITSIPKFIQRALRGTRLAWIPAASMLPTVILSNEERSKIRHHYIPDNEVLLSYYGFVAPLKGIEMLFEIVAKTKAHLLMACDFQPDDDYHKSLLDKIKTMGIESYITIMGFLPEVQLASILAASDAVVFPFRDGAGPWNTSIDGAIAQGTFVLTTSLMASGYSKERNVYFAKPGNVEEMILSIQTYAGCRIPSKPPISEWRNIADQHLSIYKQLITA